MYFLCLIYFYNVAIVYLYYNIAHTSIVFGENLLIAVQSLWKHFASMKNIYKNGTLKSSYFKATQTETLNYYTKSHSHSWLMVCAIKGQCFKYTLTSSRLVVQTCDNFLEIRPHGCWLAEKSVTSLSLWASNSFV